MYGKKNSQQKHKAQHLTLTRERHRKGDCSVGKESNISTVLIQSLQKFLREKFSINIKLFPTISIFRDAFCLVPSSQLTTQGSLCKKDAFKKRPRYWHFKKILNLHIAHNLPFSSLKPNLSEASSVEEPSHLH